MPGIFARTVNSDSTLRGDLSLDIEDCLNIEYRRTETMYENNKKTSAQRTPTLRLLQNQGIEICHDNQWLSVEMFCSEDPERTISTSWHVYLVFTTLPRNSSSEAWKCLDSSQLRSNIPAHFFKPRVATRTEGPDETNQLVGGFNCTGATWTYRFGIRHWKYVLPGVGRAPWLRCPSVPLVAKCRSDERNGRVSYNWTLVWCNILT